MNYNGALAERAAAAYLEKKRYKLIDVNYYTRFGELDLIFKRKKLIIFVEVKARSVHNELPPRIYVDYEKQRRIIKSAEIYINAKGLYHLQPRYDICEVYMENNQIKSINHLENAFQLD